MLAYIAAGLGGLSILLGYLLAKSYKENGEIKKELENKDAAIKDLKRQLRVKLNPDSADLVQPRKNRK